MTSEQALALPGSSCACGQWAEVAWLATESSNGHPQGTRFGRTKVLVTHYVSRLMLRPNLAYSSTFSCVISSRAVLSLSSSCDISSSYAVVDVASISWA